MMPSPSGTNHAAPSRSKSSVPPEETALVPDRSFGRSAVPTCVKDMSPGVHDQTRPSGPVAKVGDGPKHLPDWAFWNRRCPRVRKYVPSTAPQLQMVPDSSAATVEGPRMGKSQSL